MCVWISREEGKTVLYVSMTLIFCMSLWVFWFRVMLWIIGVREGERGGVLSRVSLFLHPVFRRKEMGGVGGMGYGMG